MARKSKITVDEYIKNREDMTHLAVVRSEFGYEIVLRLDGSYASEELAKEQMKFIQRTLGM